MCYRLSRLKAERALVKDRRMESPPGLSMLVAAAEGAVKIRTVGHLASKKRKISGFLAKLLQCSAL
jgi:hypothetical protein